MSDEKYSIEQVADIVHSEGLDYAITDYMSADSIKDPDLARLWRIAKEALDGISEILPDEGDYELADEDDDAHPMDGA